MKAHVELELLGRLPFEPGAGVGWITLHGKHVLLVDKATGLHVVDVSNPAAPRTTGSYQWKDRLPGLIAASGDHAYVVERDNRLRVLDVSGPAQPRVVGSGKLPGAHGIRGLAVAGKHVYVSTSDSLRVLDVSNLTSPKEVGVCGDLGGNGVVTIAGHYVYVAVGYGMRIIDVSNPAKPKRMGSFEEPCFVEKIAIVDKCAYLAGSRDGLYIVDVSNPNKPRGIKRHRDFVESTAYVCDVAVAGKYVLLASGTLGVIDVSRPDHPKQAGSFSQKDCHTAWSVAAADSYVYNISYVYTLSDADLFVFRLIPPAVSR